MFKLIIALLISMMTFTANADLQLSSSRSRAQCTYDMVDREGRGRVLQRFLGFGYDMYDACIRAKDLCYQNLIERNRRGRDLYARCLRSNSRGDDRDLVVRSCTVARITSDRRLIQNHSARARANDPREALRRACDRAMDECQRSRLRYQQCVVRR